MKPLKRGGLNLVRRVYTVGSHVLVL
jgi:hypothetical protein